MPLRLAVTLVVEPEVAVESTAPLPLRDGGDDRGVAAAPGHEVGDVLLLRAAAVGSQTR